MSDPRYRDPMLDPRSQDPLLDPRTQDTLPPVVEPRGNGAMWGLVAIVALIIIGGIFYYSRGSNVASNTSAPPAPTTTGAAPQPEPKPLPSPTPPAPPVQNPK